jgi:hypothetical protein
MTGSSSAVWKRAKRFAGASLFPIAPRRSPRKAKSFRLAKANRTTRAKSSRSMSRLAIKIDGEEFLIMREEEVLGIVKK